MDCAKSGLEEDWVALGANPSVLNKMLIQDRHALKGVRVMGKAAWRRVGLLWEEILQLLRRCE